MEILDTMWRFMNMFIKVHFSIQKTTNLNILHPKLAWSSDKENYLKRNQFNSILCFLCVGMYVHTFLSFLGTHTLGKNIKATSTTTKKKTEIFANFMSILKFERTSMVTVLGIFR